MDLQNVRQQCHVHTVISDSQTIQCRYQVHTFANLITDHRRTPGPGKNPILPRTPLPDLDELITEHPLQRLPDPPPLFQKKTTSGTCIKPIYLSPHHYGLHILATTL